MNILLKLLLILGTLIMTCCVTVQLLHIAIETRSWTLLHALSMAISVIMFFMFAFIYNYTTLGSSLLTSSSYMVIQVFRYRTYWMNIKFLNFIFVKQSTSRLTPNFGPLY